MMSIYFFGRASEQQVALAGGQWPNDLGDRVVAFITGLVCLHTLAMLSCPASYSHTRALTSASRAAIRSCHFVLHPRRSASHVTNASTHNIEPTEEACEPSIRTARTRN